MNVLKFLIICLLSISMVDSLASVDKPIESKKPINIPLEHILTTKGDWFKFSKEIYLGISQSEFIKLSKDTKPFRVEEEDTSLPKMLISRSSTGNTVFYAFADETPHLETVVFLNKLTGIEEQNTMLKDIIASFGKPIKYYTEFQKRKSMLVLVWNKANTTISLSYVPNISINEPSTIVFRIVKQDSGITRFFNDVEKSPNFDLDSEKKFIESFHL